MFLESGDKEEKAMIGVPYLYGANIKGRGERDKKRCNGSINTLGNQRREASKGESGEQVSPRSSKPA